MPANGRVIDIVGAPGEGKGTMVKALLAKSSKDRKICSTKNDYGDNFYSDFKQFIGICREVEDHIIVIDEAHVFVPRNFDVVQTRYNDLLRIYSDARKCNNLVIHIYHGFVFVPSWHPIYLHGIERFATDDNIRKMMNKFEQCPHLIKNFIEFPTLVKHEHKYVKIKN